MLKRPLVAFVPPFAAAIFCAVQLEMEVNLYCTLGLLSLFLCVAGLLTAYDKLCTFFCVLAALMLGLSYYSGYHSVLVQPVRSLNSHTFTVTATVLKDAVTYQNNQRAELLIQSGTTVSHSFRTLCYLPLTDEPLYGGDRLTAHVRFYLPGNMDGFDRAAYQAADRCYIASSYVKDEDSKQPVKFEILQRDNQSLRWLPNRISRYCKQQIEELLPKREGGLLSAILLGDKTKLADQDEINLRIAGLSHLVAVSGLHIGFLVAFCYLLFGRKFGTFVSIPMIILFVPIANATPSVFRAAVMYLIAAFAFILRKEADSLNSLFAALFILLLLNPYASASLSLQLSFSATLGLILLSAKMQKRLLTPFLNRSKIIRKIASFIIGSICCTICATIFTTPILFTAFGYVSWLALLSNLFAVSAAAICFIGGFLLCILPFTAPVIAIILQPTLHYILMVAELIAKIPFGRINWSDGFGVAAMAVFFIVVILWIYAADRIKWRYVVPTAVLVIAGISISGNSYQKSQYTVSFLTCGEGQAIIVSDAEKHMTLIDCGSDSDYHNAAVQIREWMQWNAFDQIDTIVLTAVDRTHARDLPELLTSVDVEKIIVPHDYKETKSNKAIVSALKTANADITPITDDIYLKNSAASIYLFPAAQGKLGVQIGEYILVLHSPTQKQLAALLQKHSYTAPLVVLSQRNTEDTDALLDALEKIKAEKLILQSGAYGDIVSVADYPVDSPHLSGDLQYRYAKR